LLGDANVGKTHLMHRFTDQKLPQVPSPTIGIEFQPVSVTTKSGDVVNMVVWDTAGQERFRSVTKTHYRRSVGCFLVYDICDRQSYLNVQQWLDDLKSAAAPGVIVALLGNKVDLVKNGKQRCVTFEEAKQFAATHSLYFFEVSAVTGENATEAFNSLRRPTTPSFYNIL
uniref:Ras-related protein Rab-4B-like n=1 Tax=Dermatophagoides pteronyssinus TaxID=6956 RepID=A0A6P6Y582_DERPT